jgi:hypothetical protein
MPPVLLAFAVLLVAFMLWLFLSDRFELPGSIVWNAKRVLRRERDRRSTMPADDLAREAQARIRHERWEKFASATAVLARSSGWSDQDLYDTLRALLAEVAQEDQQTGRHGRESNYFEFYDCGLAGIVEVLDARLKGATP